jgi:hypothetical protein
MKKLGMACLMLLGLAGAATAADDELTASYEFGKNTKVTLLEKVFDPRQARVETCRGGAGVCRINDAIPFGVSSGMPKTFLAKVTLEVDRKTYTLDSGGMYNAWGKKPGDGQGTAQRLSAQCFDAYNCIVRGLFSETAGAYIAEWAIVDGHASRTMLTGSRDVVELFKKHIEPPLFE